MTVLGACRVVKLPIGQLSFARALTETRLFLRFLLAAGKVSVWVSLGTVICALLRTRFGVKFELGPSIYKGSS